METMLWVFPILIGISAASQGHHDIPELVPNNSYNVPTPWIVGGQMAQLGEIPYQLSLREFGIFHICGASLVQINGYQFALTAAHCVDSNSPLYLVAGTIKSIGLFNQKRRVVSTIIHEKFNDPIYLKNDIAVLFLDKPFDLGPNVATISLPEPNSTTTSDVLVSGWGQLSTNGIAPKFLRKIQLPTVSTENCKKAYGANVAFYPIDETNLCAGGTRGNSVCYGDSGGPAKSVDGDFLAGIVSGVKDKDCGDSEGFPGVFTNVSHFIPWINQTVSNHTSIYSSDY